MKGASLCRAAGIHTYIIERHYSWEDGKHFGVQIQPKYQLAVVRALAEINGGVVAVDGFEIRPAGENVLEISKPGFSRLLSVYGFAHWCDTGEFL